MPKTRKNGTQAMKKKKMIFPKIVTYQGNLLKGKS